MFDLLQTQLGKALDKIRGRATLSQSDIESALKEVRLALLDADVNFQVVKKFSEDVLLSAKGADVTKNLSPANEVVKIVHAKLVSMLGAESAELNIKVSPPAIVMLFGLQGSGKTTTAAKLAKYAKEELKRAPFLVPADIYRPAAIEQLHILAKNIGVPAYQTVATQKPEEIVPAAIQEAKNRGYDLVIIDTAGRQQLNEQLMQELVNVTKIATPHEKLLVVDAMTGQEAVNVATEFNNRIGIDGIVLTKLDGDARGGAALSMRAVTGKPIKFVGLGEKSDALELFHPERMASRILGMGDVLTLIEKATKQVSLDESINFQKKLSTNSFTADDFLSQLKSIRKMGSVASLASMIPGMGKMAAKIDPEQAEKELRKVEAIILSMTKKERVRVEIIDGSRRKRIARGSGTEVQDVNIFLKQFSEMRKVMQQFSKMGLGGLSKLFGGSMPGMR